ncbi:hypothetical protein NY2A_b332L [Paramecium bursaria Chlorella virus NY2A]|uniref:Uncharacterized protein b332L n=1 Tax=Paramecium bursaria Chlorella virus NY2A TaxID=46021 RepID=A7IWK7_PBCVN|nr:hypothetical protein NY2A_b332L [Paramecium bursaria Chlorella virus NY2A]YP_001498382.1 hypothetical protein AR158_c301L [Paramecium bursaria Chlorella virus AR158]ABT14731.1 hypothetical protein NY2A_b332L [Paramecium bursaria Chlorella virus NY2A]ABU43846.1 hypothetical protein AR158_c301L [Paramecium bursaria Chlorella virus AR158]
MIAQFLDIWSHVDPSSLRKYHKWMIKKFSDSHSPHWIYVQKFTQQIFQVIGSVYLVDFFENIWIFEPSKCFFRMCKYWIRTRFRRHYVQRDSKSVHVDRFSDREQYFVFIMKSSDDFGCEKIRCPA